MPKESCDSKFVENAEAQTSETNPSTEVPEVTAGTSNMFAETTHQSSTPQAHAIQSEMWGTSREVKIYKTLSTLQLKLSKCRYRTRKHCKTLILAQKILKSKLFRETIENMNSARKILNLLQCRKQKRSKGTSTFTFTFNESITSLPIYIQSPNAYQFLSKIFLLPTSKTLEKLIQKIVIKPSINEEVLTSLRNKSKTMFLKNRLCVLLFDEVVLQPNISYSVLDGKINILRGEGSSLKLASHVVVFMLKGLFENYIQPIVYAFFSEPTRAFELKMYLKNIIENVRKTGFIVIATVCKQAINNQEAIESLIEDTRMEKLESGEEHKLNTFYVGKLEVIPFYDPPSLLKNLRNNLLITPLLHENEEEEICIAKWEHIEMLYALNLAGCDLIPKLTDQHVVPGKINKKKVKFACQVFSHSVGVYMNFNSHCGKLPPECSDTSLFILLIDDIFDSMNGRPELEDDEDIEWQPLLGALTPSPSCPHHEKWKEAKKIFKSMEILNGDNIHVPTLKKYWWNIEQFEYLSRKLAIQYDIHVVWTRRINQDPLEKFLGSRCVIDTGITSIAPKY